MSPIRFLAPVPGAILGHVNRPELFRAVAASGAGSALLYAAILALGAVSDNAATIFPDRDAAALVVWLVALVVELLRRSKHGINPRDLKDIADLASGARTVDEIRAGWVLGPLDRGYGPGMPPRPQAEGGGPPAGPGFVPAFEKLPPR